MKKLNDTMISKITATLTVTLTGDDATAIAGVAEYLRKWLPEVAAIYLESDILDNAEPEYPVEYSGSVDNPTPAMLAYDAWAADGWRLADVTIDDVTVETPHRHTPDPRPLCPDCGHSHLEHDEDGCAHEPSCTCSYSGEWIRRNGEL